MITLFDGMVAWREHRSFGGFTKTSGSGFDQSLASIAKASRGVTSSKPAFDILELSIHRGKLGRDRRCERVYVG